MAKPAFTLGELIPKLEKTRNITASASLDGFLNVRFKKFDSASIVRKFQKAINDASQQIAVDLKQALDEAMRSGVWRTVDGTDDIIDTGALLASGKVTVTDSGVTISYDAPYAALVHYGGYIAPYGNQQARVYLPPRPWVEAVLSGIGPVPPFDFRSYYQKAIEREFR